METWGARAHIGQPLSHPVNAIERCTIIFQVKMKNLDFNPKTSQLLKLGSNL